MDGGEIEQTAAGMNIPEIIQAAGEHAVEKEKPPIFGMIQRTGEIVIQMLANVQQLTIKPLIAATIAPGSVVYTDEYDIYSRL
jgi:transposase